MRTMILAAGLLVVPCVIAAAEEPRGGGKKVWQWTDEERLAARFDPELAAKRAQEQRAAGLVVTADTWAGVSGERHPELFLPIELFTSLLNGIEGDEAFRKSYRASCRNRIVELGLDEAQFWADLERVSSEYIALFERYRAVTASLPSAGPQTRQALAQEAEDLQPRLCETRFGALLKARRHFGVDAFHRILYSVVAPNLTITEVTPSAATAEHLRFLSRGCR